MKSKIHLRLLAVASIFTFLGCSKTDQLNDIPANSIATEEMMQESGQNPDEQVFLNDEGTMERNSRGYVYTQSNEPGSNRIYIYKQHRDGHLSYQGNVATGGAGNGMALGSQGSVAISENRRWLFAVNAGDNTVSSFRIHGNGDLTLVDTEPTGGMLPVSVCTNRDLVYVANSGSNDISGFRLSNNGTMELIAGSVQPLSGDSSEPAQISFSPNNRHLYVTQKMTNTIARFSLSADGVAGAAAFVDAVGTTPFGFYFSRDAYMVVSNASMAMPGASTVTSYRGINAGTPDDVNGAVPNNQTAACWVFTTKFGRYAFITNTGSDNVSSYYVAPSGRLYVVRAAIQSGDGPIDLVVASNNYHVYVLCDMDNTIQEYRRTIFGGLVRTGQIENVPAAANGLVSL